jgi:hypothetical protein
MVAALLGVGTRRLTHTAMAPDLDRGRPLDVVSILPGRVQLQDQARGARLAPDGVEHSETLGGPR